MCSEKAAEQEQESDDACSIAELRKAYLSRNAFAAHASEADKPEECVIPMLRWEQVPETRET